MSDGDPEGAASVPGARPTLPARAFLGLGSNIDPRKNVLRALQMLASADGVCLTGISTLYRTPALPRPEGAGEKESSGGKEAGEDPDFLNGVLEIRTALDGPGIEELLNEIEEALGRIRLPDKYAPRTMDLDLLVYLPPGEGAFAPHPDVFSRAFVALPLLELAPELALPPDGPPLREVAAAFQDPGGKEEADLTADLRSRFLAR